MDFSQVAPISWAVLALSIVGAVVIEGALVQVMLEIVRPVSKYIFIVARLAKLAALVGWFAFFNLYWYPNNLGSETNVLPSYIPLAEWIIGGLLAVMAFSTMPKVGQRTPAVAPRV